MIRLQGVSKLYGDFAAVKDIDLEVREGEIFSIVGPNGAGKTTILKMLVGLVEPTKGEILVGGYDFREDGRRIKEIIGFLPEESPVYEDMETWDYLRFFAEVYGIPREVAEERIDKSLRYLKLHSPKKRLGDMSKGMKRKVVIARSLLNNPRILIYDEPASGLDPMSSHFIMNLIRRMRRRRTVLMSTHNLYQAEAVSDRILILKDGETLALGTPEELRERFGKPEYFIRFVLNDEVDTDLDVTNENGYQWAKSTEMKEINLLASEVIRRGGKVLRIDSRRPSLEDVFIQAME
jgi:ABC-2 type transport system ATP-binding protein